MDRSYPTNDQSKIGDQGTHNEDILNNIVTGWLLIGQLPMEKMFPTDKQTNRQTDKQTDKQAGPAGKSPYRPPAANRNTHPHVN
jgi:hypothetical protein